MQETPAIFKFVAEGDALNLQLLLSFNQELVHSINEDDDTPLHLAALYNRVECTQILLKNNAYVNASGCSSRTPLSVATCEKHHDIIRVLLQDGRASMLEEDSLNETVLHKAATNGDALSLNLFYSYDRHLFTHILNQENVLGSTPLMNAAYNGHSQVVQLLLSVGANALLQDNFGYTATNIAVNRGHLECAMLLQRCSESVVPPEAMTISQSELH